MDYWKKEFSTEPDFTITAAEFDRILGYSVAVTDAMGSVFAAELIKAYPEAKVILNIRSDLDKWYASIRKHLVGVVENWTFYLMSWFEPEVFWAYHVYFRLLWAGWFDET